MRTAVKVTMIIHAPKCSEIIGMSKPEFPLEWFIQSTQARKWIKSPWEWIRSKCRDAIVENTEHYLPIIHVRRPPSSKCTINIYSKTIETHAPSGVFRRIKAITVKLGNTATWRPSPLICQGQSHELLRRTSSYKQKCVTRDASLCVRARRRTQRTQIYAHYRRLLRCQSCEFDAHARNADDWKV